MMPGPNYETPAEVQMLKTLGVDAVGMSTVPESLAASAAGMNVLGVSCITNLASGLTDQSLHHSEVSRAAAEVETEFVRWLFAVLSRLQL
jgi:purine-nucleoside phosphorylase